MMSVVGKMAHLFLLFLEKVFGVLRLQLGWLSSYGQQLWEKI
jgi:hypothetical protein